MISKITEEEEYVGNGGRVGKRGRGGPAASECYYGCGVSVRRNEHHALVVPPRISDRRPFTGPLVVRRPWCVLFLGDRTELDLLDNHVRHLRHSLSLSGRNAQRPADACVRE